MALGLLASGLNCGSFTNFFSKLTVSSTLPYNTLHIKNKNKKTNIKHSLKKRYKIRIDVLITSILVAFLEQALLMRRRGQVVELLGRGQLFGVHRGGKFSTRLIPAARGTS